MAHIWGLLLPMRQFPFPEHTHNGARGSLLQNRTYIHPHDISKSIARLFANQITKHRNSPYFLRHCEFLGVVVANDGSSSSLLWINAVIANPVVVVGEFHIKQQAYKYYERHIRVRPTGKSWSACGWLDGWCKWVHKGIFSSFIQQIALKYHY